LRQATDCRTLLCWRFVAAGSFVDVAAGDSGDAYRENARCRDCGLRRCAIIISAGCCAAFGGWASRLVT